MTIDRAVSYDAPVFSVAQALRDPRREAEELAARRRDAGFEEGYQRGWDAGSEEVAAAIADHRRSADRLAACASAMERALGELHGRDERVIAEIEPDIVQLAVALATELVGRELASVDAPVVDALARAVQLVPDRGAPTVRVHPDDAETAREAVDADIVRWRRDVELVADPTIERGGCVVDVGPCRIDAQLGTALERLRHAFD